MEFITTIIAQVLGRNPTQQEVIYILLIAAILAMFAVAGVVMLVKRLRKKTPKPTAETNAGAPEVIDIKSVKHAPTGSQTDADLSKAVDSALDGMVEGLGDRWSYYLDPESYQDTLESRANNYVGIGITVSYDREDGLLVQEVTEEGPAQQAGVKAGDIITHVDGASVAGDARYEATDRIAGEEGTQVELTLLGEDGTTRTVTCTRQTLKSDSVSSKLLDDLAGLYPGRAQQPRRLCGRADCCAGLSAAGRPGLY